MCKISVITVCYNASDSIEQTIQSVINQSYMDYEYIFVDGKSTDNTLEIINHYVYEFNNLGIATCVISEKDTGIYNAMNKGIKISKGDWVIFLNSGDYFCDSDVLKEFSKELDDTIYDIVYGDVIYKSKNRYKFCKTLNLSHIINEMVFCHQSSFVNCNIMKHFLFNEKYKICADHDFFINSYLSNYRFHYVKKPVAFFLLGGISNNITYNKIRDLEKCDIFLSYGIISEIDYKIKKKEIEKNAIKQIKKNKIKLLLPKKIIELREKSYYKKNGWTKDFPVY